MELLLINCPDSNSDYSFFKQNSICWISILQTVIGSKSKEVGNSTFKSTFLWITGCVQTRHQQTINGRMQDHIWHPWTSITWWKVSCFEYHINNLGQFDRPRVLGCEPVDGILVVLSSNQLNIAIIVLQMGNVCVSHLVNESDLN